jgi:response regulator RpfG family c-di-GMP phosphodiesterase
VEGFLSLLEGRTLSDLALRNAIVAWEHHFLPAGDGEGGRERGQPRPMLLSRIVSVADTFEVLCSVGVQGEPLTTREALEQLEGPLAEHYDQDAVAALKGALLA